MRLIGKCGVIGVHHQKSEMSMSGTSQNGLNGKRVDFQLKLHLVKGIVGGNSENSGDIRFGEEGLDLIYHVDTHGGSQEIIIMYIYNR